MPHETFCSLSDKIKTKNEHEESKERKFEEKIREKGE